MKTVTMYECVLCGKILKPLGMGAHLTFHHNANYVFNREAGEYRGVISHRLIARRVKVIMKQVFSQRMIRGSFFREVPQIVGDERK